MLELIFSSSFNKLFAALVKMAVKAISKQYITTKMLSSSCRCWKYIYYCPIKTYLPIQGILKSKVAQCLCVSHTFMVREFISLWSLLGLLAVMRNQFSDLQLRSAKDVPCDIPGPTSTVLCWGYVKGSFLFGLMKVADHG